MFFRSSLLFLCNITNVAQRTFEIVQKIEITRIYLIIISTRTSNARRLRARARESRDFHVRGMVYRCRRTGRPPVKLSPGHVVLGSGVPLRTSCPPTLYQETEIILHCAIICSSFIQSGTSVLLGVCSRGGTRSYDQPSPLLPETLSYNMTTQTLSSVFDMTW